MNSNLLECQVCLVVSDVNANQDTVTCPECSTTYEVTGSNRNDFILKEEEND